MKTKSTIVTAFAAGILGVGAATVAIPGGSEPAAATPTTAVSPVLRTELPRETVHRHRHRARGSDDAARVAAATTAAPAASTTTPATVVMKRHRGEVELEIEHGVEVERHHGADDDGGRGRGED